MHPSRLELTAFESQCRFRFSRASGPGGQHRNKVETSVTAEHLPTGFHATASEARQQGENRSVAIHRLRCVLAVQVQDPDTLETTNEPSRLWRAYCKSKRVRIATTNEHFPAILAEVMGRLSAWDWDVSKTAEGLETTATQIVRLLSSYPPALEELNRNLIGLGRSPRQV
jgi:hypothetical protein